MPPIIFHDGSLVGHRFEADGSLSVQIKLDNVWNEGSNRIVELRFTGISNDAAVRAYFSIVAENAQHFRSVDQGLAAYDPADWREREPTIGLLEFLRVDGTCIADLELNLIGAIDILCNGVECDDADFDTASLNAGGR
jgi:hypothetical protein